VGVFGWPVTPSSAYSIDLILSSLSKEIRSPAIPFGDIDGHYDPLARFRATGPDLKEVMAA